MIDQVIQGRYHIEKLLGEGGFGAVYQAQDLKFERSVAIKLLNQTAKNNPEHAQRFITEAKITSQLSHRNIPIVYEYGESESGQLFIVTELFKGLSLEELVNQVHLSPRQASWIVNEVNEALVAAHKRGITHRDVKPPNIYIHQGISGEEVKLLDFGIAKINNNQSHTLTGQLFGTPYFMAPEQILGQKNISPATDMYSLGAVLFYCLTRTVPYDGDSQFMIFNKHVNSPTPLLAERLGHLEHARLQELINYLMEKKPEDRPKNSHEARTIFAEIEYIATQLDPSARQPTLLDPQSNQDTIITTSSAQNLIPKEIFARVDTPVASQIQVPPPLSFTQGLGLKSSFLADSDEVITLPPIDDHFRPTAQLNANELADALLDDDDTTDNINLSRRRSQSINQIETPSLPMIGQYDSEQVTQLTQNPISSDLISSDLISSVQTDISADTQHAIDAFRDIQDKTGEISVSESKFSLSKLSLALVFFLVGLFLSLSIFDLGSNQTKHETAVELVDQTEAQFNTTQNSLLETNLEHPNLNQKFTQSEIESSDMMIEAPLPLPHIVEQRESLELPKPVSRSEKTQATNQPHKVKPKSRTKSKTVNQKTKVKRKPNLKRKVKPTSKKRPSLTNQGAEIITNIQLRISPRKASYMTGDSLKLISSAQANNKATSVKLNYVMNSTQGQKLQFQQPNIRLKQGTWSLTACDPQGKVCSSAIQLIVYDPSSLINLDE